MDDIQSEKPLATDQRITAELPSVHPKGANPASRSPIMPVGWGREWIFGAGFSVIVLLSLGNSVLGSEVLTGVLLAASAIVIGSAALIFQGA